MNAQKSVGYSLTCSPLVSKENFLLEILGYTNSSLEQSVPFLRDGFRRLGRYLRQLFNQQGGNRIPDPNQNFAPSLQVVTGIRVIGEGATSHPAHCSKF